MGSMTNDMREMKMKRSGFLTGAEKIDFFRKKVLTRGMDYDILFRRSANGASKEGPGGRKNLENDTEKREKNDS